MTLNQTVKTVGFKDTNQAEIDFTENGNRDIDDGDEPAREDGKGDRAIRQFGEGSLRATTNQMGTKGKKFSLDPRVAAVSSSFPYPDSLRTTKHPVQDFWVYDGAHPGLADRGKIPTSMDQILPNKRITEQEAVEWNRVGSKKGWMFNGRPQQATGGMGENKATHTDDGFLKRIAEEKWEPLSRDPAKQTLALRVLPKIDIENNARGIGVTGGGSGNGGMAGGYHDINAARLAALPIPMAKYNWTGSRVVGTGRLDQAAGGEAQGAGGYRAGYKSIYPERPYLPMRNAIGISRVTGASL